MLSRKWLLLALFAIAPSAAAQCLIVPGTGCPGMPPLKDCNSHPSIGTVWCMNALPCPAGCGAVQFNVWFAGPPTPFLIPAPTCCSAPFCAVYSPTILYIKLRPPGLECYAIPNNPTLIGGMFAVQPVCFNPGPGCYDLSPALQITIRP